MRILVVENYDSCPVGVVGEQLEALGAELTVINALQRHQPIPDNAVQGYHGLVVLGGAMGAYDDEDFPQITYVLELLMQFSFGWEAYSGPLPGGPDVGQGARANPFSQTMATRSALSL